MKTILIAAFVFLGLALTARFISGANGEGEVSTSLAEVERSEDVGLPQGLVRTERNDSSRVEARTGPIAVEGPDEAALRVETQRSEPGSRRPSLPGREYTQAELDEMVPAFEDLYEGTTRMDRIQAYRALAAQLITPEVVQLYQFDIEAGNYEVLGDAGRTEGGGTVFAPTEQQMKGMRPVFDYIATSKGKLIKVELDVEQLGDRAVQAAELAWLHKSISIH